MALVLAAATFERWTKKKTLLGTMVAKNSISVCFVDIIYCECVLVLYVAVLTLHSLKTMMAETHSEITYSHSQGINIIAGRFAGTTTSFTRHHKRN